MLYAEIRCGLPRRDRSGEAFVFWLDGGPAGREETLKKRAVWPLIRFRNTSANVLSSCNKFVVWVLSLLSLDLNGT